MLSVSARGANGGIRCMRDVSSEATGRFSSLSLDEVERLATRLGRDGLGTDGLQGYLDWLIRNRPVAFLGILAAVLPRADTWEELNERCREEGWGESFGFLLRDQY